jgi:hypothetical protein
MACINFHAKYIAKKLVKLWIKQGKKPCKYGIVKPQKVIFVALANL